MAALILGMSTQDSANLLVEQTGGLMTSLAARGPTIVMALAILLLTIFNGGVYSVESGLGREPLRMPGR
jgi:hypothetical protein